MSGLLNRYEVDCCELVRIILAEARSRRWFVLRYHIACHGSRGREFIACRRPRTTASLPCAPAGLPERELDGFAAPSSGAPAWRCAGEASRTKAGAGLVVADSDAAAVLRSV